VITRIFQGADALSAPYNRRAVLRLASAAGLRAATQQTEIRLTPTEDHRVFIRHERYAADWQIRFPEQVTSQEGAFMTSAKPRMEWRNMQGGVLSSDWSPSEDYSRQAFEQMGRRLRMIQGMSISPRMRAGADRIDLTLHLKNISGRPFHAVWCEGGCLQHRTERFFDPDYDRSYILTGSGLTALNRTGRSIPIRSVYVFEPAWYETADMKAFEYFWGRSNTRPAAAFIASEASRGKGAIGIAWDQSISLRQNSDDHHRCMHSSPFYGDIRPGELVTRRGVILFGDTAQEVAERFKSEAVKPYLGAPV
jgi:hypothetical protein